MLKILVTGSKGMLGRDLVPILKNADYDVRDLDIDEIDITKLDDVTRHFKAFQPDITVNCAAYTAVDKAECEPELAFAVNRDGPGNLARVCNDFGIPLIHISTDYVFNGEKAGAYCESDPCSPIGVYAQSKMEGESAVTGQMKKHIIIRTAWLYGVHGSNFVKTMLKLGKERNQLNVVSDQYGSPTSTEDLAHAIVTICENIQNKREDIWGIYHYSGKGYTSWSEFARTIFKIADRYDEFMLENIKPIKTEEYPTPAKRPTNSSLECEKISRVFDIKPQPWQDSLERMIKKLYVRSDG